VERGWNERTTRALLGRYSITRGNHPDVSQDSIAPKVACPFLLRSLTSSTVGQHYFIYRQMWGADGFEIWLCSTVLIWGR
jgi:hypothetical protein